MSKRSSLGQSNTLFNYFQSPGNKSSAKKQNGNSTKESNLMGSGSDNEDDTPVLARKRNRTALFDSDSDTETSVPEVKTKKKPKIAKEEGSLQLFTFEKSNRSLSRDDNVNSLASDTQWFHERLEFLKPDKIRDINGNRSDHPDYDEKTLYVPQEFLNKQTPAMRQWWILKSKHYDTVLFFKIGKFYEFYHMDAVIGVNYLNFSFVKGGEFAHSGFPEVAYGRMASTLIEQGFKVARVEQTETPEMMNDRCRGHKVTKYDRVVRREICEITTQATCLYGAQMTDAKQSLSCYLLAIAEKPINGGSAFGVCFVDTSVGDIFLGQFEDDKHCSRLLRIFAQYRPALILLERRGFQWSTLEVLKKTISSVKRDVLTSGTQFLSPEKTIDLLMKECYFRDKNNDFEWPTVLAEFVDGHLPKLGCELALKALGACVWYLKDSELDIKVLSMKKFHIYKPADQTSDKALDRQAFMILDFITIENLNLLGEKGTLQKTLDYCETSFGKRLLQQWICRPLCQEHKIQERQNAIHQLCENDEVRQAVRAIFRKLPDLERLVSKIHTFGNRFLTNHPDSRAILYENNTYSKRKILDLINTIQGFEKAQEIMGLFEGCTQPLIKKLTHHPPEGKLVDVTGLLQYFREAFDQNVAVNQGKIIPQKGIEEDYDGVEQEIADISSRSSDYLEDLKQMFRCEVSYVGKDNKRFQIEIPENRTHKVTNEFQLEGARKGFKRYSTATSKGILVDMIRAETKRNKIVQDLNRRIFEKFSDSRVKWEQVIHCLMMLDVLCGLAEYGKNVSRTTCFPNVLPFQERGFIDIKDGVHPNIQLEDFVPNSTQLGIEGKAKIMLLTGPNMGGKSTLMRQVALIIIMAQMGCPIPAASCTFTLVDRIFTRFGAYDDILKGQSTFFVELSEASSILRHATRNSVLFLDELGRGTSTHDGNAIATAYVKKTDRHGMSHDIFDALPLARRLLQWLRKHSTGTHGLHDRGAGGG
uniref:DNA mismatch repair protein n=1 Tax=Photinus pyralis TaxID=7054 RepID=A0A1Y1KHQ2_PHOPY